MSIDTSKLASQGPKRLARETYSPAKLQQQIGQAGDGLKGVLDSDVKKEGKGVQLYGQDADGRTKELGEDKTVGGQVFNDLLPAAFGLGQQGTAAGNTVDVKDQ